MTGAKRKQVLIWLPVIILPVSNLIAAAVARTMQSPSIQVLVFAVIEELLYRWLLLDKVLLRQERIKPVISIIIVAVIFAAMHLWNMQTGAMLSTVLLQAFFAFCFSIWAGAVVWKTDKIWIPLLVHVLLNTTAVDGIKQLSLVIGLIVLADGILVFLMPLRTSLPPPSDDI